MNVIGLFALVAALPCFKHPAPAAAAGPDTELQLLDDDAQQAEGPLLGCGWFDSSHDLNHGLTVREDVSASELPLASWLELHLGVGRAAGQPA